MMDDTQYSRAALPLVSRTFALGIEQLELPLRDEVGVAYLVCRILDTVEDTTELDAVERIEALEDAARCIADPGQADGCAERIAAMFVDPALDGADHELARNACRVTRALHALRPEAVDAMRPALVEMALGMAETVRRELSGNGVELQTMEDLERYCYYVAGTVGGLLTSLFALDRPSITPETTTALRAREVRFGLGLQVTNIIKNVTEDRVRGATYIPKRLFQRAGIELATLVDAPHDPRGREVVAELVEHALGWLDAALDYTLALPASERDLRMFCALPLAFAVRTLELAVRSEAVFSESNLKIRRVEVHAILERMRRSIADDHAVRAAYDRERAGILRRIERVRA